MRTLVVTLAVVAGLAAVPRAASAVTVDQIVALSKAGVSEAVIVAVIDRDRTIFALEPDQIVTLKREGVGDAVVMAMLKSGRDEAEAAIRAEETFNAATYLAGMSTEPSVLIIGQSPDQQNAAAPYPGPVGVPAGSAFVLPYSPFIPAFRDGRRARRRVVPVPQPVPPPALMAIPPNISANGIFFTDNGGPARGIFFHK